MASSVFAYDGNNLIETVNSSGGLVSRYEQTQNLDEPLAEDRSGTISYYEADGLGSVSSLTSATGALADTYTYDSFGNLTNSTGSVSNPLSYTGREFDTETGLYYYRARYYDPNSGRFLSEDPLLFGGGGNFYRYANNSPINAVDPTGTNSLPLPIAEPEPFFGQPLAELCAANPILCLGIFDGALAVNDAYGAYNLGVAYGWWGKNSPQNCSDDCGKLLAEIAAMMELVQSRYTAMMTDPLDLFNSAYSIPNPNMPNAGTWLGHLEALENAQRGLQNLINAAKAKGCKIPPQAQFLAELPLPSKPGWKK